MFRRRVFFILASWLTAVGAFAAEGGSTSRTGPLRLLFLGDMGHHQPAARFKQIQPVLAARGIDLTYTDRIDDLHAQTLAKYDGLVLYANIDAIAPPQARALLDYVASGKGFVPLHCASYCFRNNDEVVALIGAQFQKHGAGVFHVGPTDAAAEHPVMRGYQGFESWDETYVHARHNEKGRTVLEYRSEPGRKEPWTWVRTHGKGRVFYTAWGHDERTWSNPGFQNLIERGIRWACGDDPGKAPAFGDAPKMTPRPKDLKPFEYVDADVPFYPAGKAWGTTEKSNRKMQLPVSPAESVRRMVLPLGFTAKLYAAEPQLAGKPIAMNWDERGRLWICETLDYPNELRPAGKGRDRIRICEDADGDGVADKFTVFAEKLSIPTAIAFYRGGAIVQDGVETVYLRDEDGDDKADLRKPLVTGWAMGDTHGGVSNFQYGLDGWYYAMQGYNPSRPTLPDGTSTSFRMGFFRFRMQGDGPATCVAEIEFLRSTNNNTWGLGISEEGLIFGSTANGNPSEFMPIANRYYEKVRGWSPAALSGIAGSPKFDAFFESVRQVDHHGGFTAAAGHALYTARNYPREYWNRTAFVCEPTGHIVATFLLQPDGAGFRSRIGWNLLASDDEWTAPIMAEVGPDGNVWVLDWYNYIVQHNPTPAGYKTGKGNAYESNLRDKTHGRIYRLLYDQPTNKDSSARTFVALSGKSTAAELITALASDNFLTRRHAQRLLVERGRTDVAQELQKLLASRRVDSIGLNPPAIHAIWTLSGLNALGDGSSLTAALGHPSAGVRRNAALATPKTAAATNAVLSHRLLDDPEPQVRLAALLVLSETPPSKEAGLAVARMLSSDRDRNDRWMLDAAASAAARHDVYFLQAQSTADGRSLRIAPANVLAIVAEHYARGGPKETIGGLLSRITEMDPASAGTLLRALGRGWPKGAALGLTRAEEQRLAASFQRLPPTAQLSLLSLVHRSGGKLLDSHTDELADGFLAAASDPKKADEERAAAARQLIDFRKNDGPTVDALLKLITPKVSTALAAALLEAIGSSEAPSAGPSIVAQSPQWTPALRATALRILLRRGDWTKALLEGAESGRLQLSDLSLDQKQALNSHPDKDIAAKARPLLARQGGLPSADRQKVIDELLPQIERKGDVARGKAVFTKTCAKCHTHGGEGAKIGPDLTGMAVHPKRELLIPLLDPSRSVEGNFRVYSIVTDDGRVYTGLLSSESKTAVELIDGEAKKHSILRENIEELVASPKSLMPDGFEKQHSVEDLTDLLEFLTAKGKFLPLPLGKAATAVSTRGLFYDDAHEVERFVLDTWGRREVEGIPFYLIDPSGDRTPNIIVLHSPLGDVCSKMPKSVEIPCRATGKTIHLLGGVSGWGFPLGTKGSPSMTVRLKYADGVVEDHALLNGVHLADYIRRIDVPESKFAIDAHGRQVRYLKLSPKRQIPIDTIELVKGPDQTSPVVLAVTVESP